MRRFKRPVLGAELPIQRNQLPPKAFHFRILDEKKR